MLVRNQRRKRSGFLHVGVGNRFDEARGVADARLGQDGRGGIGAEGLCQRRDQHVGADLSRRPRDHAPPHICERWPRPSRM